MPHLTAVRLDTSLASLTSIPRSLRVPRLVGGVAGRVTGRLRRWPVESQQVARRNAMIACTALAERRAERDDVEDFLRGLPVAAHA